MVAPSHPSASDDNDGNPSSPWASLEHAVSQVEPGDTVLVAEGRYSDDDATHYASFDPARAGTAEAPITFRSCPHRAAVLVSASEIQAAFATSQDYIVVDGFRVEGTLKVQGGDHCTLVNNEVVYGSMETSGPEVADPSLNWGIALHSSAFSTVRNNRVHDMNDSGNRGHNTACVMVGFSSHDNLIEYNWADAGGGTVYSAFGTKGRDVVDNTWRYNVGTGATAAFFGIGSTDGEGPSERNHFHHNVASHSDSAFELDHACHDYAIEHNTSWGCEQFLYGGFGADTWVDNVRTRVWHNVGVELAAVYVRGDLPAEWGVFLAEADHNFWQAANIAERDYGSEAISTIEQWREATSFGEGSAVGDPMLDSDGRLSSGSPAAGIARTGGDPGAFSSGDVRIGPSW